MRLSYLQAWFEAIFSFERLFGTNAVARFLIQIVEFVRGTHVMERLPSDDCGADGKNGRGKQHRGEAEGSDSAHEVDARHRKAAGMWAGTSRRSGPKRID